MPTYRSLIQRGPLLLFAPCHTGSVARNGRRAGNWLAEGRGDRSSKRGGSWFSIFSLHLYWHAHGWRATDGGRKELNNSTTKNTQTQICWKTFHCQPAPTWFHSNSQKGGFWQRFIWNLIHPCQTQGWSKATWMIHLPSHDFFSSSKRCQK